LQDRKYESGDKMGIGFEIFLIFIICILAMLLLMAIFKIKRATQLIQDQQALKEEETTRDDSLMTSSKNTDNSKLLQDAFIDNNPIAIQIVNQNGYTVHFNQAFEDLFALPPKSENNIFEDDRLLKHHFHDLLFQVKRGDTVYFPEFSYNAHDKNPKFDNKVIWIQMIAFSIPDKNQQPDIYIFMYQNVTAKRMAIDALRQSESLARAVIENTATGISVRSNTGQLLLYNEIWRKIWEVDKDSLEEELAPKENLILECWDNAYEDYIRKIREVYTTGGEYFGPEINTGSKGINKQNPRIVTQQYKSICNDEGEVERVVILTSDITERKQAEEERLKLQAQLSHSQKMESIGRLAGGVSHDFNNMLSVIIGYSDIALLNTEKNSPAYNYITEINKAAVKSANLTRQLLAFARKQAFNPIVLDLNQAVNGMKKMLSRLLGEHIKFTFLPGKSEILIHFDPSQLDQILANLCVNARDAILEKGVIVIETSTIVIEETFTQFNPDFKAGEYALLTVSDNGCGMSAETLEHIFEPFFTTKEIGKGTGLGLATVYGIIRQNHGAIEVYSELNKGSSFKIYLPRYMKTNESNVDTGHTQLMNKGTETLLLVEDEQVLLNMTKDMLSLYGYEVICANSAKEAINISNSWSGLIHLLITDVIMPEMNGKQLSDQILKSRKDTKCLYMSGYTDNIIEQYHLNDNNKFFLQKPFNIEDLANLVRKILDNEV